MLNALIVGGTGLISTGITKHLLARGAKVTMYNRGLRQTVLPEGVRQIVGDRDDREAFVQTFEQERFDVVFDMICFTPEQAEELGRSLLRAFEHPFTLSQLRIQVGLTIGYALAPLDGPDANSLLKRADAAMYAGKQAGRHCLTRGQATVGLSAA